MAAWESLPKLYPPSNWRPPPPAGYEDAQVGLGMHNRACRASASKETWRWAHLHCRQPATCWALTCAGHSAGEQGALAASRREGRQRLAAPDDQGRAGVPISQLLSLPVAYSATQAGCCSALLAETSLA